MNSSTARFSALLLSLGFTLLSQLPVVTAEHSCAGPEHPAALQSVGTVSETSTVYDANDGLWKRWSMETIGGTRVVVLSTSHDGLVWNKSAAPCFAPAKSSAAWDSSSIASPVVILNESAVQDRRYMMWYSGASEGTAGSSALAPTAIGLAFSSDGRHFTRLPANESPAGEEGLILSARAAFPASAGVTQGCVGEPRISIYDGKYTMSFFRVATNDKGEVLAAGLGSATSTDGIKWTLQTGSPVTVELVGKTTTTPALVHRLRQLVDAYSECPM